MLEKLSVRKLSVSTKLIIVAVTIVGATLFVAAGGAVAKPLIGIGTDVDSAGSGRASTGLPYVEAVEKSGGIAVLLPPTAAADVPALLARLDGLVLIGGMDYPPALYGQSNEAHTKVMTARRADFDVALSRAALADKTLPVLGICAGCQVLNIGSGGCLVQDIPSRFPQSKVSHAAAQGWVKGFNTHTVSFEKDSRLFDLYGEAPLVVPTAHHQCVDKVGKDFRIVGRSADGLPEAIEKEGGRFVVGVQFHPERDYARNQVLFDEFIRQSAQRQQSK